MTPPIPSMRPGHHCGRPTSDFTAIFLGGLLYAWLAPADAAAGEVASPALPDPLVLVMSTTLDSQPVLPPFEPVRLAAKGDEPEPPLPLEAVQAPSRLANPPRSAQDDLPDLTMSDWRLAPIRWGGSAMGIFNHFRTEDAGSVSNTSGIVNVRASSHIYQPWFAQVMGNAGLVSSKAHRSPASGTASDVGGQDTRSNSTVYGGALNLFPQSRFPFQAFFDRSNSQATGGGLASTEYSTSRIGLRQTYRPPTGTDTFGLSYDRSVFASDASSSRVDALQGSYSVSMDEHALSANTRVARANGGLNGESSQIVNFNGSHLWRPQEGLSVSTTAHFGNNQLNYISAGRLGLNDSRLMQANSTFNWIPDEDLPLSLFGGASLLSLDTRTSTDEYSFRNIGTFLGGTYRFSSRLIGSGNLQFSETQSGKERFLLATQTGSLSYSGESLNIGNYMYHWSTGGSVANQSISGSENAKGTQSASLFLGHSLTRTIGLSAASLLNISLGQSITSGTNTQTGAVNTLVHSAGLSWRLGYGERLNGVFSFVGSDNLTRGAYNSHFRMFTLNGNGVAQLTRRSSLTASANINWSQQTLNGGDQQVGALVTQSDQARWMGAASIGYNHLSPFDIRNLLYNASFIYTSSQVNQRVIGGDPDALTWQVTKAFQQRLDYRIGRLTFQVLNSFAEVNGKKNASLFFQVIRSFGDF